MILIYSLLVLFCTFRIVERKSGDSAWFILAWALVATSFHLVLMIVLGVFGFLRPVPLVVCAAGITLATLFGVRRNDTGRSWRLLTGGLRNIPRGIGWLFLGLALFAVLWLMTAALLLPPSAVDSLTYHLPPVYEFVLRGRIITMPADQVSRFAYPLNGDLLLSWPLIFIRDVSATGIMGTFVLIFAAVSVYALSRRLGLASFEALISAVVFFFMPVSLVLSGSGYVELIATVYTVMAVFFILQYHERRERSNLYLSSLALGVLAGIKYSYLLVVGYLGLVLLVLAWRRPWRDKLLAGLLFLLTGGYWYFHNWLIYGNPLFPLDFIDRSFGVFHQGIGDPLPLGGLLNSVGQNFWAMISGDLMGRDLHGGFGVAVQVLGWLSAGVMLWRAGRSRRAREQYIVFGLLPLAWLILGLLSPKLLRYDARLILFAMPVLCYSIGGVLQQLAKWRWPVVRSIMITTIALSAVLSMVSLAKVRLPSYNVIYPLRDMVQGRYVSRMLYACCSWHVEDPCIFWAALDAMTINNKTPWRIRQYYDPLYTRSASLYGFRLQNRVDGLSEGDDRAPDAVIVMNASCNTGGNCAPRRKLAESYRQDPRYALAADTARSALFIRNDHMISPEVRGVLAIIKKDWGQRYIGTIIGK